MTPPTAQIDPQHDAEGEEASTPYPAPSSPLRAANPWAAIVDQFGALPPTESKPPRRNPRPPGVLVPGSATDAVLQVLLASPGRFLRAHEILDRCPRHSRVAVSWALLRLQRWGLVETIADAARSSRYMRYRAKTGSTNEQPAGLGWSATSETKR